MGILSTLLSLLYMILFFVSWIVASLFRPLLLVTLVASLYNPVAALQKLKLIAMTIQYLLFCHDKKWKQPEKYPLSYFENAADVKTKTVIFLRHGESTWNDTFNRGGRPKLAFVKNFIPNLLYAASVEWYFYITAQVEESWFYDSPLSDKGLGQALGVHSFLQSSLEYKTPKEADYIRHMLNGSQLVSSNLRRAISTMAIGLQERLSRTGDSMLIMPELQEISRNPDALSITPPLGTVVPAWTDPDYLKPILNKHVDTSMHTGNKPVDSNGLKRMQAFCKVAFEDIDNDCIVACGHSLWFRSFFQTHLPRQLDHVAKRKKLVNGGCVGFQLKCVTTPDNGKQYMIDPASITVLHGGI